MIYCPPMLVSALLSRAKVAVLCLLDVAEVTALCDVGVRPEYSCALVSYRLVTFSSFRLVGWLLLSLPPAGRPRVCLAEQLPSSRSTVTIAQ